MKILITQETDWLIKTPAQQHHLAEMLSLRGHDIRVIDYELLWKTRGRRELISKREVFNGVSKIHQDARITVIRPGVIKIPGLVYVSLILSHKKEIERQIKDFAPDVIVGFGILNSYLALKAAAKNRIPFIYYWIDVLDRLIPFRAFQPIGKIVETKTLKKADRVLAINEKLKDYVVKMGARPERASVLRAGINFDQFREAADSSRMMAQYNIRNGDVVLFFMGWLYNFSGLKEVALQLAKTQNHNHNVKLLIVGEGDAYNELQQIRVKHKLQDRLILTGKRPYQEIPALVATSNICLLPAYPNERIMQDIVPIKMYEYMAMKKPVIATRLPGVMTEFGEDNGVVYVNRPEDVIAKATELIQKGSLEELGSRARRFVERLSWDNITTEFERILEEVVKERKDK